MASESLSAFEDTALHAGISALIRRRSTNRADVREEALRGLDLSSTRSVLDLGCGYGFMTDAVARRLPSGASIVGVDACAGNRQPFLDRMSEYPVQCNFVEDSLEDRISCEDGQFDLVLASYSLYFFPALIPEIARVLKPAGLFIAVTHTADSCRGLLRTLGLPERDSPLMALIERFSAENGADLLSASLGSMERIDFHNTLEFSARHGDDWLTFLRFKLPLLAPGSRAGDALPSELARAAQRALDHADILALEKSDVIFRCKGSKCR